MLSPHPEKPGLPLDFLAGLRRIVGDRYLLDRDEERLVYECDACILMRAVPDVVVLPGTTDEVAAIVRLCRQYKVPFVPRGAGTGLSGGALTLEGGVLIGLNRMNRILNINPARQTATVEVGAVNAWLNRSLAPYGLFYAPDPSSQAACTVGGNIAENAGGIHCVKYGVTVDHILACEVVLPSGEVVWVGGETRRAAGYNLLGVLVGSEGTLGIITRATLRLTRKPAVTNVVLAAFRTIADATGTVSAITAAGLTPSALEFMDAFTVRAVNEAFCVGFPENSEAVLLIELDGEAAVVSHELAKLQAVIDRFRPTQTRVATTEADCQQLWKARKGTVAAYGRMMPAMYVHDCVIPRSKLTEVLTRINAICEHYGVIVGNVFHAGDGNLHPNLLLHPNDQELIARVLQAGEEIFEVCLSVGGTLSGEHGIGCEKSHYMSRLFSEADMERMKRLKAVFDPDGLANPSKIFPMRRACGESGHRHTTIADGIAGRPFTPQEDGLWI
jgi:glycolate oxidase subunit GlcD